MAFTAHSSRRVWESFLDELFPLLRARPRRSQRRRSRPDIGLRPDVQGLEDRTAPATYMVPGQIGTLAAAITQADGDGNTKDTIVITAPGSYPLNSDDVQVQAANADVPAKQLTIMGALPLNPGAVQITGGGANRIFVVNGGMVNVNGNNVNSMTLVLRNLTVTRGNTTDNGGQTTPDAVGAGILNNGGSVTLSHANVTGNSAHVGSTLVGNAAAGANGIAGRGAEGGGIFSVGGSLTLISSVVSGNHAVGGMGQQGGDGIPGAGLPNGAGGNGGNGGPGGPGEGGGIFVASGTVLLDQTTIRGNTVKGGLGNNGGRGGDGAINGASPPGPGGSGGTGGAGGSALGAGLYDLSRAPSNSDFFTV